LRKNVSWGRFEPKKESQMGKACKAREAREMFRKAALGEYVWNKKKTRWLSFSSSATDDKDDDNLVNDNTKNNENFITPVKILSRSSTL
jgi:hypothetical protein